MKRALTLLRGVRGVRTALVATNEGVLVAAEGPPGIDAEAVAALASRFLAAAARSFRDAGRPGPKRAELKGSEGRLLLADFEDAFLAVVVGREAGEELEAAFEAARASLAAARVSA